MPDLRFEREQLALADQHIADSEVRLTKLRLLAEQMTTKGQDATEAERMVQDFEAVLEVLHVHRKLILDAIDQG